MRVVDKSSGYSRGTYRLRRRLRGGRPDIYYACLLPLSTAEYILTLCPGGCAACGLEVGDEVLTLDGVPLVGTTLVEVQFIVTGVVMAAESSKSSSAASLVEVECQW